VQEDLEKGVAGKDKAATAEGDRLDARLVDLCHVLLNSNRFLYVE
jgi:hypothetical protein